MNKYIYNGPVIEFDKCVANNWRGETIAVSEAKARSNLAYKYKKEHGKLPNTKVSIPGKLTVVKMEESKR